VRGDDLADGAGRARNTDLLPDDRAHAGLERIPTPGDAHALGPGGQRPVLPERGHDVLGVVSEVEEPADPRDVMDESVPGGEVEASDEVVDLAANLDRPGHPVDLDGSAVHAVIDRFDAGDRSEREEGQQCVPVQWWVERETGVEAAVGDEAVRTAATGPELGRRRVEDVVHHPRHLADRAEAGRERDVIDGEVAVVEQPASEVRTPGASHLIGGGAHVLEEEAAEVAAAHAEASGEVRFELLVERAVDDEAHGPAHELGAVHPGIGVMAPVRAAPQAGAEPVRLGRGRALVLDDVGRVG